VSTAAERQESDSLATRAYDELEHRLVTLALTPGQFVLEKDLVEWLGIGRTPVREAMLLLARQGLFRILPRKGILVASLEPSALRQVIETRRVLERLLVVKAAERAKEEQRQALRTLADRISVVEHDAESLFRLDRELDEALSSACQNRYLVEALAPLHVHCRRLWFAHRTSLDIVEAAGLHVSLARAVAANESTGAIRALNGIISILEGLLGRLVPRS
jgi:DNA-binding GntR family transcriptional regulator